MRESVTREITKAVNELLLINRATGVSADEIAAAITDVVSCLERDYNEARVERDEAVRAAKAWEETAAFHLRNEQFWRDLVMQIGEPFGIEARTSDDGSVQEDVLGLKVPELVANLRAFNEELAGAAKAYIDKVGDYTRTSEPLRDLLAKASFFGPRQGNTPLTEGETAE